MTRVSAWAGDRTTSDQGGGCRREREKLSSILDLLSQRELEVIQELSRDG